MSVSFQSISKGLADAIERAGSSVVRIQSRGRGPASGVVWATDVVVTASHAIGEEPLSVVTAEGSAREVQRVARDPSTGLAVLRTSDPLGEPATWSEGAGLRVGHLVVRLGRPGRTVRATVGIVSASGSEPWTTHAGGRVDRYLESDAAHPPGFSGGPLVGLDGEVLGINSSRLVRGASVTLPTSTVRRVVEQLLAAGKVRRSYLGIRSQPVWLPAEVREQTGEEVGLWVLSVEPGGPAAEAGVLFGDTVLRLGGDEVKDLDDLHRFLREDRVGQSVPVQVLRGGQVLELTLTLGERP